MLLRLNIRHALPQTAIRNQQSRILDSHMIPAQIHSNNQQAQSNKGVTQPDIDIDSYQSRHAYGARNMSDFSKDNGQEGFSDARSATSRHAQSTWSLIENAARRGNYVQQQAYQKLFEDSHSTAHIEALMIPDPSISVQESEVVGESDRGDISTEISTTPFASIEISPGSAETYLKDPGFIRRWITQGKYDIYA